MAKLPIRWIEARTYCHATEEEERVVHALAFACPGGAASREVLEDHFGNPLLRLTRRLEDAKEIRATWEHWAAGGIASAIESDVDARVDDEGILHFRLDKQAAFRETLVLAKDSDTIDVRLKLVAFPAKAEEVRRVARALLTEAS